MLKNKYEKTIISGQIKELLSGIDKFITTKQEIVETLKKVYLNCSNNN